MTRQRLLSPSDSPRVSRLKAIAIASTVVGLTLTVAAVGSALAARGAWLLLTPGCGVGAAAALLVAHSRGRAADRALRAEGKPAWWIPDRAEGVH